MMTTISTNSHTRVAALGVRARRAATLGALALAALVQGCAGDRSASAQPRQPAGTPTSAPASGGDIPEVLATIGDQRITVADLRPRIGEDLDKLESRYRRARHEAIDKALERVVQERLVANEASRQGKSEDEVLAAEAGGSLEPNDVEIAAWYQDNQARLGGRTLEQVKAQIADHLRTERRAAATDKLRQRLMTEQKVTINLEPFRLAFDNDGAPTVGPADAPVTLVEFSDFQCPYCGRFFPTLKQLERNFGDTLRIVYRQFPLTGLHPYAFKAAEASLCANDQGKFWALHDAMFQDQDRLAAKDLKAKASRIGLDEKKFEACLDSGRHADRVQEDLKEGGGAGVTGTPALFVNGIPIDGGAVPYEVVAKAIRRELARAKR